MTKLGAEVISQGVQLAQSLEIDLMGSQKREASLNGFAKIVT